MIYLTHLLNEKTPAYANDPNALKIVPASRIADGAEANTLQLSLSNHVGTHIDFPRHFDDGGKVLDDFPADFWDFKQVQLLDLPCEAGYLITVADLEGKIALGTELLLIRTGFERLRDQPVYWHNNPAMDKGVGLWLREKFPAMRALGFDSISMNCYQKETIGCTVHREFLASDHPGKPILIIEDMKLAHIAGGIARAVVAPLLISGADGAQVTILAEETI